MLHDLSSADAFNKAPLLCISMVFNIIIYCILRNRSVIEIALQSANYTSRASCVFRTYWFMVDLSWFSGAKHVFDFMS